MEALEAGKRRTEQFILDVAKAMKPEISVDSLLWWGAGSPDSAGAGETKGATVPLRIFKGKCWRSIVFGRSDVEGCVQAADLLKKYEGEIAQVLADL